MSRTTLLTKTIYWLLDNRTIEWTTTQIPSLLLFCFDIWHALLNYTKLYGLIWERTWAVIYLKECALLNSRIWLIQQWWFGSDYFDKWWLLAILIPICLCWLGRDCKTCGVWLWSINYSDTLRWWLYSLGTLWSNDNKTQWNYGIVGCRGRGNSTILHTYRRWTTSIHQNTSLLCSQGKDSIAKCGSLHATWWRIMLYYEWNEWIFQIPDKDWRRKADLWLQDYWPLAHGDGTEESCYAIWIDQCGWFGQH